MIKRLNLVLVLFLAMSCIAQAQKEGSIMKARSYQQASKAPQYFAEIRAVENEEGMKVIVSISDDYKSFIVDKAEIKRLVSLSKQEFSSVLDALNFMSMNGWSFVDQVLHKNDRVLERRILMSKPIGGKAK